MDKRKSFLKNSGFVEKIGLMVALFIIVVVFTVINKNYFSTQNLLNILTSASLTGLVAIGETYLIIAGLIDLSPGLDRRLFLGCRGASVDNGRAEHADPPAGRSDRLLIGFLNGMGVNKLKLEPFIVTLSAMSIFPGAGLHPLRRKTGLHLRQILYRHRLQAGPRHLQSAGAGTDPRLPRLRDRPEQNLLRPQRLCAGRKQIRRPGWRA